MLYLVIFGVEFVNFSICQFLESREKTTMSILGTNNDLFRNFRVRILKQHCHIWNQHPRICLVLKFRVKVKMSKFGTKNTLFGYFWVRMWKNYSHIWNHQPQTSQFAKFRKKTIMFKSVTQNALFGYFWAGILKDIISYSKSASSNLSNYKILQRKKNAWILPWIFAWISYLGVFGLEFQKTVVIFEISLLEFV